VKSADLLVQSAAMRRFLRDWILVAAVICVVCTAPAFGEGTPRLEFFAAYSYNNVAAQNRHGFNGAQGNFKFNLNPQVGILADFGGQYRSDPNFKPPPNLSFFNFHDRYLHVYQALVGPELTQRGRRFDFFEHTLVGLVHGAAREQGENFLGFGIGGGTSVHGQSGPSLRIQADYIPNRGGGQWFNDVRLGIGVVFKILK
jgi:hypothetical protein